jgi:hypothetical protein
MPTSFNGINHLKLPAQLVQKTHDFYQDIVGCRICLGHYPDLCLFFLKIALIYADLVYPEPSGSQNYKSSW